MEYHHFNKIPYKYTLDLCTLHFCQPHDPCHCGIVEIIYSFQSMHCMFFFKLSTLFTSWPHSEFRILSATGPTFEQTFGLSNVFTKQNQDCLLQVPLRGSLPLFEDDLEELKIDFDEPNNWNMVGRCMNETFGDRVVLPD